MCWDQVICVYVWDFLISVINLKNRDSKILKFVPYVYVTVQT